MSRRRAATSSAPRKPKKKRTRPRGPRAARYHGRTTAQVASDAFAGIDQFLTQHARQYAAVGLTNARAVAGRAAHDALAKLLTAIGPDLRRGAILPAGAQDELGPAHAILHVARDAVHRRTRGRAGAAKRSRFGLDVGIHATSPESLRDGLTTFLRGVREDPATAKLAYVTPAMTAEMERRLAAMNAIVAAKGPNRLGKKLAAADVARAHQALEDFYDEFAAATNGAFWSDLETRKLALSLVPRARGHAPRAVRPVPVAGPAPALVHP